LAEDVRSARVPNGARAETEVHLEPSGGEEEVERRATHVVAVYFPGAFGSRLHARRRHRGITIARAGRGAGASLRFDGGSFHETYSSAVHNDQKVETGNALERHPCVTDVKSYAA